MCDRKPIIFIRREKREVASFGAGIHWVEPELIILAIPVPGVNLYQLYQRVNERWHGYDNVLHSKENIEDANKGLEKMDRLTALTLYGIVVDE